MYLSAVSGCIVSLICRGEALVCSSAIDTQADPFFSDTAPASCFEGNVVHNPNSVFVSLPNVPNIWHEMNCVKHLKLNGSK